MTNTTLQTQIKELSESINFLSEFVTTELYPELGLNAEVDLNILDHKTKTTIDTVSATSSIVEENQKTSVNQEVTADLTQNGSSDMALSLSKPILKDFQGKVVIWSQDIMTQEHRILLKNILAAVNISPANVVLETSDAHTNWSNTPLIFSFGIDGLPGESYIRQAWKDSILIKADSLARLQTNIDKKRALWTVLKDGIQL